MEKTYGNIPKLLKFWTDLKLYDFDLLWKNYGTMEKTMELWKKLWYYGKNYGTLIYYGNNYGTMEKTMVLFFC